MEGGKRVLKITKGAARGLPGQGVWPVKREIRRVWKAKLHNRCAETRRVNTGPRKATSKSLLADEETMGGK